MRTRILNLRVSDEEKKEIEKFVDKRTDFDNPSAWIRSLIKREMRSIKEKDKD